MLMELPTLSEIDAELERRRNRPQSPAALAETASGGRWKMAAHLDLLNRKLCDLAAGKIKRLIVTMPPRHGKSQLCSRYFPAWYLGTRPDNRVILCSYEANFAAKWGGEARDVLAQFGPQLFGVRVSDETSARDNWKIEGREGGMITAGVGGPVTGWGANLFIIDDPIKNSRDAHSQTIRQGIWDWWQSTALTRLEPDASVLVIQTRWHKQDLAGKLLGEDVDEDERDDEAWEIVNLPAIAEDEDDSLGRAMGEPLWPERWPSERLLKRKKRLGSYVWGALYQQRPTDPEGGYFKRNWFRVIEADRVPDITRAVRCWDLAATAEGENGNDDPDWLAGCRMALCEDGKYYILHVRRARETPQGVEKSIVQSAAIDGIPTAIRIEQEGAASGKIVGSYYTRLLDRYDARFVPVVKASKFVRSGPFNAACERGDVILVAGAWVEDFLEELTAFPTGSHDDQVDAAVGAYTELSAGRHWGQEDWKKVFVWGHKTPKTPREKLLEQVRGVKRF